MIYYITQLSDVGQRLDYSDSCPVVFALCAPFFILIPILWIICLPLYVRIASHTCKGVLEFVPQWLIITENANLRP